MAYFSNGSEGEVFDDQCARCKFGQKPCPISAVQMLYNYDACNVPVARKILDSLVANSGECAMFKMSPATFAIDTTQIKLEL